MDALQKTFWLADVTSPHRDRLFIAALNEMVGDAHFGLQPTREPRPLWIHLRSGAPVAPRSGPPRLKRRRTRPIQPAAVPRLPQRNRIDWVDIAPDDGRAFRDHVIRRQDARLRDLAHHLADTGGPLHLMDGSRESLTPLWDWFGRQLMIGMPGLPPDAMPSAVGFLNLTGVNAEAGRAGWVAEAVGHYLFVVAQSYRPEARWDVWISPERSNWSNRTGIILDVDRFVPLDEATSRLPGFAFTSHGLPDDLLGHLVESWFPGVEPRVPTFTGLEALAREPRVPWDDPVRRPPKRQQELVVPPVIPNDERATGFALVLARASTSEPDDPDPMDERAVAAFLHEAGFRSFGRVVRAEDLSAGDLSLTHPTQHAFVDTFASDGRLRSVAVEPLNATLAQWEPFEQQFRNFAALHDLRVAEET
jgi:hypothetical protein